MENESNKKNIFKKLFIALSIIIVFGVSSFLIYESGFSLEVKLNGVLVGYAKNNDAVEQAIELVDSNVLKDYGEDAYFDKDIITEKVRDHKEDVVESDVLSKAIEEKIEVYKPASVIMINEKETVAVSSERIAFEVLEELKRPYQNVAEDSKVLDVYFNQDVEVVTKDVWVERILSYEGALLPFKDTSGSPQTYKLASGKSVYAVKPLLSLSNDKNKDVDAKVIRTLEVDETLSNQIILDVVSVLEDRELVSIDYKTNKVDDDSLYTGDSIVKQSGETGEKEVTYKITYVNGVEDKTEKVSEEVLSEPVDKIINVGTKQRPYYGQTYSSELVASIVNEARVQVNNGVPYRFGGASPSGFDCSGLTSYVYGKFGIYIPRNASSQANWGTSVSRNDLQAGDLVFFRGEYGGGVGHVGIYVGNGQMIHAPYEGTRVRYESINSSYFASRYVSARRIPGQ